MAEAATYLTTPGIDLFGPPALAAAPERRLLERRATDLEALLRRASAPAKVAGIRFGPVLTTFLLELEPGVRLRQVAALAEDMARCLLATSVEVVSRPGESLVGVQMPDPFRRPVVISELLQDDAFAGDEGALPVALGRDAFGDPVVADLAELHHLLVVGRQGAGKTNAVHAILQSLLFRFGTVRLWLLVAGGRATDYAAYEDIPHMLAPVAATGGSLTERLSWLGLQVEHRHRMIRAANARSLESYNRHVEEAAARGQPMTWRPEPAVELELPFLARIVTVVDAVDELCGEGARPDALLELVHRGAQVGLHLVVVARTLGVKPLEDLLRQGSVARLCLRAATPRMSQTLLGFEGAEMLGINGDAYLLPPNAPVRRVHLPLVVEEELEAVGDHWRAQGEPLDLAVPEPLMSERSSPGDELYEHALEIVVAQGHASTSYLQRTLRIGYNHAAALVERMEREGHVGRPDAIGRREVTSSNRGVSDEDVRPDDAKGNPGLHGGGD